MPSIPISRITYLMTCLLIFEIIKLVNKQPIVEMAINLSFFSSIYVVFYRLVNVISIPLFGYEMLECASWIFTHSGFNIQVLLAIDLSWCFEHHFSLIIGLLLLVAVLLFLTQNPFFNKSTAEIDWHRYIVYIVAMFICLYSIVYTFTKYLYPFSEMENFSPIAKKMFYRSIDNFLKEPIEITTKTTRNLIILEVESLEQQILGRFNTFYPYSMPFMSNLSLKGQFWEKMESQPYTTWSVASLFAAQCNLPLLMTQSARYNSAKFHLLKQHRCIGDYLKKAGYHLTSYLSNIFIGHFKEHLKMHHWEVLDFNNHHFRLDYDLFNYLGKNVLPNLTQKVNQPFVLHIANADTHPFPSWIIDKRCKKRVPKEYPKMLQSFDCVDQIMEKFFKKLEKSGLLKNTEVLVYGDHILMSSLWKGANIIEPRYIAAMMPFRKKETISKSTSIYDLAPTFMDILGIEYKPKFPFGAPVNSKNKVGLIPDPRHFKFIYDFYSTSMKWDKKGIKCDDDTQGFCKKT